MINWNIAGLVNAKRANRYVEEFDIGMIQETWLEKNREKDEIRKLDKGYI